MKRNISIKVGTAGMLIWLALFLMLAIGWVMNIVTIAHSNFSDLTGMLVLRTIGVFFAPLGGVLGWF